MSRMESSYSSFARAFFKHLLPDLFVDQDPTSFNSTQRLVSITELVQACQNHSGSEFFVFENVNNLDVNGVIRTGCFYCQISNDTNHIHQLIVCNSQDRSMVVLKEDEKQQFVEWIVSDPSNQTIIDLNRMGRRWEGSMIDNIPCGYGIEYDERDEIAREGFVFQGQLVCWGYENYPNSKTKKYCGQYFEGKRFGRGVMYDLQNQVEFDGLWQLDQPKTVHELTSSLPLLDITTSRAKLTDLSPESLNNYCLSSLFLNLSHILVDPSILDSLTNFTLENLPALEQVEFSHDSHIVFGDYEELFNPPYKLPKYPYRFPPPEFCGTGRYMMMHRHEEERKKYLERSIQSKCCIRNCPILSRIDLVGGAFCMYTEFSLTNLPFLQSIYMKGHNFEFANSFVLKGNYNRSAYESSCFRSTCIEICGNRRKCICGCW